jgi:hypothetical protein
MVDKWGIEKDFRNKNLGLIEELCQDLTSEPEKTIYHCVNQLGYKFSVFPTPA